MATLASKAAFKTFVITDTIAFSLSTVALLLQLDTSPSSDSQKARYTAYAATFIYYAVLAMVLAFASGIYVVLTRTTGLAIVPWVVCGCVGSHYSLGWFGGTRDVFELFLLHRHTYLPRARRAFGLH
ncbi:hypothetical protein BT93_L4227 [Corymbia citriodora subsp. variegata]|uniref:PGG domain-containing protein n=1 Tax=Corymbia citriodora subsp. variegata TaxID=360336 RepID=A0A8T0CGC1_CORYI|nr:hypothetical protein BT93_L4227 [Corymbia citriodora subsp. variegata]